MATDDRAGNGKTFAEMMSEANSGTAVNPDAACTQEQLITLSDAILELLEGAPLSLWGKQCIVGSTLMRLFTGEPEVDRRLAMMSQQMTTFADKTKEMAMISVARPTIPDLSIPGAMDFMLPDVGHA